MLRKIMFLLVPLTALAAIYLSCKSVSQEKVSPSIGQGEISLGFDDFRGQEFEGEKRIWVLGRLRKRPDIHKGIIVQDPDDPRTFSGYKAYDDYCLYIDKRKYEGRFTSCQDRIRGAVRPPFSPCFIFSDGLLEKWHPEAEEFEGWVLLHGRIASFPEMLPEHVAPDVEGYVVTKDDFWGWTKVPGAEMRHSVYVEKIKDLTGQEVLDLGRSKLDDEEDVKKLRLAIDPSSRCK